MLEVIQASALRGFAEFVHELGGDPEALLTDAGIGPERVGDDEAYIPYRTHAALLARAPMHLGARTLHCDWLTAGGLRSSERSRWPAVTPRPCKRG